MHVAKLLEAKGSEVVTIRRSASVSDALGEFTRRGIGSLVVSDDGRTMAGIITERDVIRAVDVAGPMVLGQAVSTLMSITPVTCRPHDVVEEVMASMTDRRVRHVPVVTDGELAGIISIGDVVKARIDELERDHRELVDYINAR